MSLRTVILGVEPKGLNVFSRCLWEEKRGPYPPPDWFKGYATCPFFSPIQRPQHSIHGKNFKLLNLIFWSVLIGDWMWRLIAKWDKRRRGVMRVDQNNGQNPETPMDSKSQSFSIRGNDRVEKVDGEFRKSRRVKSRLILLIENQPIRTHFDPSECFSRRSRGPTLRNLPDWVILLYGMR